MGVGPCGVCSTLASQACAGCGVVHYCGKEHQRQHWPKHRAECRPYKAVSSPHAGKFLVASRKLPAGQILMEDAPLVVGPKANSSLVCLGCHAAITQNDFHPCPECWWPLCSSQCASSPLHLPECSILAQDTKHIAPPKVLEETPRYDIILLLRCLLLRSLNPSGWETLLDMAHHSQERQQKEELQQLLSVHYLTEILKVDYDVDTVHQVKGAISTNAVEIQTNSRVRALYPTVRLLNNACVPNVHLSYGSGEVMQVRTAVPIQAGETLYICYTGTMLPLWQRRAWLTTEYHFTCDCDRCGDPTEVGTYFSNPKCPECTGLYLQPSTWLGETVWVCPICKTEQSDEEVQQDVKDWLERIKMSDVLGSSSFRQVNLLLQQAEDEFHPQHYVWTQMGQTALYQLRHNDTERGLQLRSKIWQRLLVLYSTFEPGLTRRRGMTLLETGKIMLEAAKKEYEEGDPFLPEFTLRLRPVIQYLEEAEEILSLEPKGSTLLGMAKRAQEKRVEVQEFLGRLGCTELRAE
ncbi:SET domain-containing protein SmydA-8-like isoform X1 [Panulirus ornatus]